MKTKIIKPHFGLDILADVRDFKSRDRTMLVDLLSKHKVLRFSNQKLTADQLVQFSEIFGECWNTEDHGYLGGNGESKSGHPDNPKVTLVSNRNNGVLGSHKVPWHNDVSHRPWNGIGGTMPTRILYADTIPPDDPGLTGWFDQEWLYENCPLEIRERLENIKVWIQAPYPTSWKGNEIDFVQINPVTGKKSILLQEIFLHHAINVPIQEFQEIKKILFNIALDSRNVIEHSWRLGDLIINNNYCTAHQRWPLNTIKQRTLWRTTFQVPELIPKKLIIEKETQC